jgi:hypothetical protein
MRNTNSSKTSNATPAPPAQTRRYGTQASNSQAPHKTYFPVTHHRRTKEQIEASRIAADTAATQTALEKAANDTALLNYEKDTKARELQRQATTAGSSSQPVMPAKASTTIAKDVSAPCNEDL